MFIVGANDTIEIIRSSAAPIHCVVDFTQAVQAGSTTPTPDVEVHIYNAAATGTILAAAGAGNVRVVKFATMRNVDAALPNDITVQLNRSATLYERHKVTLLPGETLEYNGNIGMFTLKQASVLDVLKIMTADSVHATAVTFADIAGLTQPLLSGKTYAVSACLFHIGNATTTGAYFGYNIGAAPTAARFGNIDTVTGSVLAGVVSSGAITARDTACTAQTTGAAGEVICFLAGYIKPSADGTFALRAASEVSVAAGLTVRAGSWMWIGEQH